MQTVLQVHHGRPQPTAFPRGHLFKVIVEYADTCMEMLRDLSSILSVLATEGQRDIGSVVIQ